MRRAVVAFGVFAFGISVQASPDWTAIADKLGQSIVTVENAKGSCTGFVINDHAKGDKDYVLTADHCYGPELYADHALARAIFRDGKKDLMILEVDDLDRPAVALAAKNPAQGDEVASLGFGYALEKPMLRIAHISNPAISLPEMEGNPYVMIDAGYVPGQSGGPNVNASGEVVSIVQAASGLVGIGQGTEAIRDRIHRYLPKKP